MVPFSPWDSVIASLWVKPSIHKSQEIQEDHSHTHWGFPHTGDPCPCLSSGLHLWQNLGGNHDGICHPSGIELRKEKRLHYNITHNIRLFLNLIIGTGKYTIVRELLDKMLTSQTHLRDQSLVTAAGNASSPKPGTVIPTSTIAIKADYKSLQGTIV